MSARRRYVTPDALMCALIRDFPHCASLNAGYDYDR
jgi:hypothetical protein